jgi:DNA-binding PadR family transcriptional regulator
VSATRLLVLGVVRALGATHGYQVRRALLSWSADRWANIRPGSIYHALKKLAGEGLLESLDTESGDGGPDRTRYRVTDAGIGEFFMLLDKSLVEGDSLALNAALPFVTTLERKNALYLLTTRIRKIEGVRGMNQHLLETSDAMGKPPHVREMFDFWVHIVDGELTWLRAFVARVEAGEYVFADDSPEAFGVPRTD